MILDNLLAFSNTTGGGTNPGDSPTATTTTASTNQIDLHNTYPTSMIPSLVSGQGARDMGIGDDPAIKVLCQVTAAFTTGTGATLSVALQGAPDNGSNAPASFVTWYASPVTAVAGLGIGVRLLDMDLPRPPAGQPIPRFLQLAYIIATGTMTAGTLKGFLVLDRHDMVYNGTANNVIGGYPPGIVIAN